MCSILEQISHHFCKKCSINQDFLAKFFSLQGFYFRHKRRLDPSNRYNNLDNVQHMDNLEIKMNISNWIIRLRLTKWAICENASTLIQENNFNQKTLHMPWYHWHLDRHYNFKMWNNENCYFTHGKVFDAIKFRKLAGTAVVVPKKWTFKFLIWKIMVRSQKRRLY